MSEYWEGVKNVFVSVWRLVWGHCHWGSAANDAVAQTKHPPPTLNLTTHFTLSNSTYLRLTFTSPSSIASSLPFHSPPSDPYLAPPLSPTLPPTTLPSLHTTLTPDFPPPAPFAFAFTQTFALPSPPHTKPPLPTYLLPFSPLFPPTACSPDPHWPLHTTSTSEKPRPWPPRGNRAHPLPERTADPSLHGRCEAARNALPMRAPSGRSLAGALWGGAGRTVVCLGVAFAFA